MQIETKSRQNTTRDSNKVTFALAGPANRHIFHSSGAFDELNQLVIEITGAAADNSTMFEREIIAYYITVQEFSSDFMIPYD